MTATSLPTQPTSQPPLARYAQPLRGWRHPRITCRDQLTHAVMPGRTVAECGVIVVVLGESWPQPGAGTPLGRCAICTQAVESLWKRIGPPPDVR